MQASFHFYNNDDYRSSLLLTYNQDGLIPSLAHLLNVVLLSFGEGISDVSLL